MDRQTDDKCTFSLAPFVAKKLHDMVQYRLSLTGRNESRVSNSFFNIGDDMTRD